MLLSLSIFLAIAACNTVFDMVWQTPAKPVIIGHNGYAAMNIGIV
tara:strand:+ start:741 stop:875 length:135 start_codon:yes stop_codon:yes gene_type:complete